MNLQSRAINLFKHPGKFKNIIINRQNIYTNKEPQQKVSTLKASLHY